MSSRALLGRLRRRCLMRHVLFAMGAVAGAGSCAQPECVVPDYRDAECRVIAENELGRLRTASGVEVRLHDPLVPAWDSWAALGRIREDADGRVNVRVAGLDHFQLSLEGGPEGAVVPLEIDNFAWTSWVLSPPESFTNYQRPSPLRSTYDVAVPAGERVVVDGFKGECPARFNLAFVGDIQTNPLQFERILERIAADAAALEAAGEPLLGLVIVGDLTEWSYEEEFHTIAEILARSRVPIAVTPGNHDIFRKIHPAYNMNFGPGTYATSICGVRIALFDSGSAELAHSVEARLPELFERGADDTLIAATHYPPHFALTGDGWTREDQAEIVLAELALAEADLVVAGHVHALLDYQKVEAGAHDLREVVVGTGGATQGVGVARFGYLRVRIDGRPAPCFVEVPPPGWGGPANEPLSAALPYCE